MDQNHLLENKTAVVTGGTRGIGFAVVKRFLENGANVAYFGSKERTVAAAAENLRDYKDRILGLHPDLTDEDAVAQAFAQVKDKFGSFDILVNNAGASDATPFLDYTYDRFKEIMRLNVDAAFVCSHAAALLMKAQGGGVIINTGSMVTKYGQPSGVAYPASKYAVNGMTVSLARELGRYNIRVNAVAPGVTLTDMVKALPERFIEMMKEKVPINRFAEPEDVANVFLFLASPMADYVSGSIVYADGAAND